MKCVRERGNNNRDFILMGEEEVTTRHHDTEDYKWAHSRGFKP